MAVTDLTDSLPYWARQGVGYPGGPGPTGGPGSAPMGAGNSASWLQYLQQMFGPGAAQAADLDGHGDGNNPPVSPNPLLGSSVGMNPPQPPGQGILPQARGVAVPPAPPMMGGAQSPILPQARGVAVPPNIIGSQPSIHDVSPPGAANPLAAAGPVPGPLASGGATAAGASANPRFVQLDQGQNTDPTARNRGPQMTALNLAGLFGGGGAPGAPRGVNPANLPAPNAQTVSGPLAAGGMSNAPWTEGPQQRNIGWPRKTPFGPDWRDLAGSRSGYQ
jgi:hypothetical protein